MTRTIPQKRPNKKMPRRRNRGRPVVPWVDVLEIFTDLRSAADRARRTPGYKPRNGMARTTWAVGLKGFANTIYSRRRKGLPIDWHMAQAKEMLRMSP